ncbi:MAG TPA: LysM peptidoglycan-binding domain-containing protein [Candidatus Binatia bacterium]|nr:LysM peptidoglycan-binding domain-containing protein [Candidatus Binatia bacterium]
MLTRSRFAFVALGATVAAAPAAVMASTYVVRPGDTLSSIALRHGSTVQAISEANHLTAAEQVRVGQLLQIPDPSRSLPGYVAGGVDQDLHTVRTGESLWSIARRYGVDTTALARTNGLNVNAVLPVGAVVQVPGRLVRVSALLAHVAQESGVDPGLVKAVAWTESRWQQDLVSPTGAVGLMQVEPYTGEWVSEFLARRPLDIHVAADNVAAGALLLGHLLRSHTGDTARALAAYYQGDASIAESGLFVDTTRYQHAVLGLMAA